MFKDITEFKRANKEAGYYFFSSDTMAFFASEIESGLYENQCFITSEKKCFDDNTGVYKVRQARENGSVKNLSEVLDTLKEARDFVSRV